jgi:hypothetical protein
MTNPRGAFKVKANGQEYTLWLGMSVLADLQGKHGQDVLKQLEPPLGAGNDWLPPLCILVDMFLGALQRYHSDIADRYLVDEILAENGDAFEGLMAAAFPEQETKKGNGRKPKQAA